MSKINGFVGRRNFVKLLGFGSTITAATMGVKSLFSSQEAIAQQPTKNLENPSPQPVSPSEALQLLIEGNKRFAEGKIINPNQSRDRLLETSTGQFPYASILGCADSRVPTEVVFDRGVGDLFVVRVAGNVASEAAIGSLEFGSAVLGSQLILVLGHVKCGAVAAAVANEPLIGRLGVFVEDIKPAIINTGLISEDIEEISVVANIKYQVKQLGESSTILRGLVQSGKLKILGGMYNLSNGKVTFIT